MSNWFINFKGSLQRNFQFWKAESSKHPKEWLGFGLILVISAALLVSGIWRRSSEIRSQAVSLSFQSTQQSFQVQVTAAKLAVGQEITFRIQALSSADEAAGASNNRGAVLGTQDEAELLEKPGLVEFLRQQLSQQATPVPRPTSIAPEPTSGSDQPGGVAGEISYSWQIINAANNQSVLSGNTQEFKFVPKQQGQYRVKVMSSTGDHAEFVLHIQATGEGGEAREFKTYYVDDEGKCPTGTDCYQTPQEAIDAVLAAYHSNNVYEIKIAQGTYGLAGANQVILIEKGDLAELKLTIRGGYRGGADEGDWDDVTAGETILSAENQDHRVIATGLDIDELNLEHLTIRGSVKPGSTIYESSDHALAIGNKSTVNIDHCRFIELNNFYAIGIKYGSTVTITNSLLSSPEAAPDYSVGGGGIYVRGSATFPTELNIHQSQLVDNHRVPAVKSIDQVALTITDSEITGNRTGSQGAGLNISGTDQPIRIERTKINNNQAGTNIGGEDEDLNHGAAIYLHDLTTYIDLINIEIAENTGLSAIYSYGARLIRMKHATVINPASDYGFYLDDHLGTTNDHSNFQITNSVIANHAVKGLEIEQHPNYPGAIYVTLDHNLWWGVTFDVSSNNIDFADSTEFNEDPAAADYPETSEPTFPGDNYHIDEESPLKDRGKTLEDVTDDIDGDSRPAESAYDIGADEYVIEETEPTPTSKPTAPPIPTNTPGPTSAPSCGQSYDYCTANDDCCGELVCNDNNLCGSLCNNDGDCYEKFSCIDGVCQIADDTDDDGTPGYIDDTDACLLTDETDQQIDPQTPGYLLDLDQPDPHKHSDFCLYDDTLIELSCPGDLKNYQEIEVHCPNGCATNDEGLGYCQ
ncbi:MAG: hypothetical protein GF390_02685 [Candidatus Pacebacteria bacterium]|nr:hypothetical protein [Candidatus Paceibacterota bacterium]